MKILLIILCLMLPTMTTANGLLSHEPGIWSLPPTESMKRWLIIHNLDEGRKTGIYHIEVIGRNNDDDIWRIKHLVAHMAITEHALKNSVITPLNKGGVYPETFDNAYAKWKKENKSKVGKICLTSVLECM